MALYPFSSAALRICCFSLMMFFIRWNFIYIQSSLAKFHMNIKVNETNKRVNTLDGDLRVPGLHLDQIYDRVKWRNPSRPVDPASERSKGQRRRYTYMNIYICIWIMELTTALEEHLALHKSMHNMNSFDDFNSWYFTAGATSIFEWIGIWRYRSHCANAWDIENWTELKQRSLF